MGRTAATVRALGRLGPAGPWVGFRSTDGDYRLVFGQAGGSILMDPAVGDAGRVALLAAAMAYFTEALDDPPEELAATIADVAGLVRAMGGPPAPLGEATDAIDDGLPGDTVAMRLAALMPDPTADPLALLRRRFELLAGGRSA